MKDIPGDRLHGARSSLSVAFSVGEVHHDREAHDDSAGEGKGLLHELHSRELDVPDTERAME